MTARPSGIDTAMIQELASLVAERGLSEIEIFRKDLHFRLVRSHDATPEPKQMRQGTTLNEHQASSATAPPAPSTTISAPLVGKVYLSLAPGSRPLAATGTVISQGQTVAFIESLGAMTPVQAPRSGCLTDILVRDSQPVEYDEPLFVIA
jgi:acetyl-CoA carboxylase biotin carboxyl carrier protein